MQLLLASRETINFVEKIHPSFKVNLSKKKMSGTAGKAAAALGKAFSQDPRAAVAAMTVGGIAYCSHMVESKVSGELFRVSSDDVNSVSDSVQGIQREAGGSIISKSFLESPLEWNFSSFIESFGPFIFLEFCFFLIALFYIYRNYFLPFSSEWVKKEFSLAFVTKFIKFLVITNIFSIFFLVFLINYSYGLFNLIVLHDELTKEFIIQILKRLD